ncbi:MAG TPA: cysteine hydrolase [Bacteroidetes bacterium]|nr:cysteine hydrolase [Bacteroidota bacterium]HEX05180.1 cysteine hydrolase [Bacteroidota bacterium]
MYYQGIVITGGPFYVHQLKRDMSREQYLTIDNRALKAKQFLSSVHNNGLTRGPEFDARVAALLVLDMQQYFFKDESHAFLPSGEAIIGPIGDLIDRFQSKNRPVLFTQHLDAPSAGNPMRQWWKDYLTEDDERAELLIFEHCADVRTVIKKSSYDAFLGTDLESRLKDQGISQVVICGVMTHLCVETTARSAFCRGFNVWLPVDATATISEEHHLATLRNLSHGFARMTSTVEMLEMLR